MRNNHPRFVISLDFELMWGVRDNVNVHSYTRNLLGVRESIPAILNLFSKYHVRATWAAVGLLLFSNKKELLENIPYEIPAYKDSNLSPYSYLNGIGNNENDDPLHYGKSLAQKIVDCKGMELASHTFSHYYCLEPGQTIEQFRGDLEASRRAVKRLTGADPISLVFPRNQYNAKYLPVCRELGFKVFRGNELSWLYRASSKSSKFRRAGRLMDAYFSITGDNGFRDKVEHNLLDVPASRFLRPYSKSLAFLWPLHLRRIKMAMAESAISGKSFHLWWHPHNFGLNLSENLTALEDVLKFHKFLESEYGMMSSTMGDFSITEDGNSE